MTLLVDTGPMLAAADSDDPRHHAVVAAIASLRDRLLIPDTVLGELSYMLGRQGDPDAEASGVERLIREPFSVVHITDQDVTRACELVRTYRDNPIGFVDASIVAIAERLGITRLLTLDQRHFRAIKPAHCEAFEILPS